MVTDIRTAYSKYRSAAALRVLLDSQDILDLAVPDHIFSQRQCTTSDLVFHDRRSSSADFFFMYACVMRNSFVRIPFHEFFMGVLCA